MNSEANDNHVPVIRMLFDGYVSTTDDCLECFQPKFYYAVCALIWKIIPITVGKAQIIMAQLINCFAGLTTVYISLLFLNRLHLSDKIRFFVFSLVALNPGMIGIDIQVTNDSFVVMLVSAMLYNFYVFLNERKMSSFVFTCIFAVLTGLTKGNGLPAVVGVGGIFALRILFESDTSFKMKKSLLSYFLIFLIALFVIVPKVGQYSQKRDEKGSAFSINGDMQRWPGFFETTYVMRPGVISIYDSILKFRFFDMIKTPWVTQHPHFYPDHRTSVWSQVYGGTHFVFFNNFPNSWKTENASIRMIGRWIIVLAMIPILIFVFGLLSLIFSFFRSIFKFDFKFLYSSHDFGNVMMLIGYAVFIALYACMYRDYSSMKAIFVFPALIPFIYVFSKSFDSLQKNLIFKPAVLLIDAIIVSLLCLYVITEVCLFFVILN